MQNDMSHALIRLSRVSLVFAAGGSPCTSPKTQDRNWKGLRTNLWISTVKSNQATNQATNLATNWTLNLWINYKLSSKVEWATNQTENHHNSWLWAVSVYKTTLIKVVVGLVSSTPGASYHGIFVIHDCMVSAPSRVNHTSSMDYSLYKLTTSLIISWAGLVVTVKQWDTQLKKIWWVVAMVHNVITRTTLCFDALISETMKC